jgi:hypothetical protein
VEEMKRKETERKIEMDSMKEIIMKYLLSEKSLVHDNYNLSNILYSCTRTITGYQKSSSVT